MKKSHRPLIHPLLISALLFTLLIISLYSCQTKVMEPPVIAPFTDLDTICTNDWWNRAPNPIHNVKVERDQVVAFGLYTVSKGVLKLSTQLYPLYPDETRTVRLEVERDGQWQEIATEEVRKAAAVYRDVALSFFGSTSERIVPVPIMEEER